MKVTARDITRFMASPPDGLVAALFYGHDSGLVTERSHQLASRLVPDLEDPFAVSLLDGSQLKDDPALLLDSAAAVPATGGLRFVRVSGVDNDSLAACRLLLQHKPAQSLTILTSTMLNTRSALVRLMEQDSNSAAIGCYHDSSRDLAGLAREHFTSHDISISNDAMTWLVSHLGADRMASRAELEKLVLLAGTGGRLELDQLRDALGDGAALALDDAVHAAASGDMTALSRALDRARREQLAAERLLRVGLNYFRRLYSIHAAMAGGADRDRAFASAKPPVFFSEKSQVESHLRYWNANRCLKAMMRLNEAEDQCRSGYDAETVTSQALLSLALMASRPG